MPSKVFKYLSRYDEFGQPVGLNYGKEEEHKTWCGTTISLFKLAFMIFYISHLAIVCLFRKDPDIQYSDVFRDFDEYEKELRPVEIGFDIAVEMLVASVSTGKETLEPMQKQGIDETYFNLSAFATKIDSSGIETFTLIPTYPCIEFEERTGRRPFRYVEKEKFERKLATATCIDMESIEFKGSFFSGQGVAYAVMQCINTGEEGKPVCQDPSLIEQVAQRIQVVTLASQNYFSIENYTNPIQAEIGIAGAAALKRGKTIDQFYNVEYSVAELFDTQLRIFDDVPDGEVEYMSAHASLKQVQDQFTIDSQKIFSVNRFNLMERGKLYKRRVATIWSLFEDFGGMNEAICIILAPLIVGIAQRSFSYDLASKHMMVKKRNDKKLPVPQGPTSQHMAQRIIEMSGIRTLRELIPHKRQTIVCMPACCNMRSTDKKVHKMMKRASEQYEESTDVLNFIRMGHRVKIIEQLLFSKGQLAMIGLHKERYLKAFSSESEEDPVAALDSEDNFEKAKMNTTEMLLDYDFSQEIDKKLWNQCILPPKTQETDRDYANATNMNDISNSFMQSSSIEMPQVSGPKGKRQIVLVNKNTEDEWG